MQKNKLCQNALKNKLDKKNNKKHLYLSPKTIYVFWGMLLLIKQGDYYPTKRRLTC